MTTLFCGVDPGLSGAVALIGPGKVTVFDMPVHQITVAGKKRKRLDLHQLCKWFELHGPDIKLATIEDVGPQPQDSVKGAFTFGFNAGAPQTAIAAFNVPMTLVTPQKWKAAMCLSSDKDESRRLASRLFPGWSHLFSRVKDDGRAEAVLLALYGSKL